ncbi:hypothetical protein [Variovorax terrae]|uniref:DUF4148 domain-containing protein n=1 Tax=Variovorax terrae TaxID=2923278 RepID=A0A9X2AQ09_9BURK|nr:hypothetical protein [Variovorax terrae]MCJ0765470.1 hypothetical protein [Variovorax terrae]
MNRTLIATALIAAATMASTASFAAGEADYAEQQQHVNSTLTRAEVKTAAAQVSKNFNWEPNGSRVAPRVASGTSRLDVRNEAVAANRAGKIGEGELGMML